MTARVVIYGTRFCGFCAGARQLFERKGVRFDEIPVDRDPALRAEMTQRSGRRTVPQIFINDRHVGGYDDLKALERDGKLDEWLARTTDSNNDRTEGH
ncbi:MAG: glutaredoxin 3 [Xanthomonadaceae bacterium]|nr:glutaredoxin 3 [Xanthomonadaceae bacterium]